MHLFIDERFIETVTAGGITITSVADRDRNVTEVSIDRAGTAKIILRGDEIKSLADLLHSCACGFSMRYIVERQNKENEAKREAERAAAKAAAS